MKIDIKKINFNKTRVVPLFIAEHAFWFCLALFILSLAISLILFYRYADLAERQSQEQLNQDYFLKQEPYQSVLSFWQKHEEMFKQADTKEYLNPFLKAFSN